MRNAECGVRDELCRESHSDRLYSALQILPVLDLLNGIVVRGVGGRRDEYQPVESVLTASAKPLDVARAFRERLGLTTLYVADLDGILHQRPNETVFRQLVADGFELWIDGGLRSLADAGRLLNAGAAKVIVGLETLYETQLLTTLIGEFGAERIIFSLDLKAGHPLFPATLNQPFKPEAPAKDDSQTASLASQASMNEKQWPDPSPLGIARTALGLGVAQMIVLDLASVGEQRGPSTLDLCLSIRQLAPSIRLITGGGVRNAVDLEPLQAARIDGVLLATALHNGAIGVGQVCNLPNPGRAG